MVAPLSESSSNPNLENLLGDNKRCGDRKNGGTRPLDPKLVDSLYYLASEYVLDLTKLHFCKTFLMSVVGHHFARSHELRLKSHVLSSYFCSVLCHFCVSHPRVGLPTCRGGPFQNLASNN